ncbi:hypothetical protein [uncultured Rikenella sp.]|uniref:DUF4906 domain-containing protein n=1 Tax=uncultured Rikenella sp. TaxID=368003 RepID=UPI0025D29CDB|nr:hypothetical protein [uncultured Rikenella sp.]
MSYISRFILWTGCLSVLLLAGGCRRHTLDGNAEEDYALVDAMLILRCNELETRAATREEQERQVNDLNLFFVHKSYPSPTAPEVRHYYFSSVDVAKHVKLTNIRLGKYRMYAVANAGKSLCPETTHDPETPPTTVSEALCSLTEDEIKAMVVKLEGDERVDDLTRADNLLMSSVSPSGNKDNPYCDETMEVRRGDEGVLPTITINLVRRMAKVEFSYELVGDAVGKMKINSIATQYIPLSFGLFGKEGSKPAAEDDFNPYVYPVLDVPNGGNLDDPIIFYLPENRQGDVEGINTEQDRNGLNAPKYASYLYLDGEYEGSQYGFSIYFGDDMQGGNFDVRGNAYYQMHLQLGGPDLDDIRVSSLKIDVIKHFAQNVKVGNETEADVELICSNYFNDEVKLLCSATGATGVSQFEVIHMKEDGTTETLSNVSEHGGFTYVMLRTDNQPGTKTVKCKVKYSQTALGDGGQSVTILFKLATRYGTTTFHTHDIRVTP